MSADWKTRRSEGTKVTKNGINEPQMNTNGHKWGGVAEDAIG